MRKLTLTEILHSLCKKSGIEYISKEEENEDQGEFHYRAYANYRSQPVRLGFLFDRKNYNYMVYTKPESPSSKVDFIDLSPLHTSSQSEALDNFRLYLSFAKRGSIPEEWLPVYRKWEKIRNLSIPKSQKKCQVVYQTTEENILRDKGGIKLSVRLGQSISYSDVLIQYNSPEANESIRVSEGQIIISESHDKTYPGQDITFQKISPEKLLRDLFSKKKPSKPIRFIPQYENELIKLDCIEQIAPIFRL